MISEHDIAVYLLGLAVLLGVAKTLGEIARKLSVPAVVGELLAGVLLGPTVLGRVYPGASMSLFPRGVPANMLSAFTLIASVLLLTLAGLEIDLAVVIKRRREAALTSFTGVVVSMLLGVALGWVLPDACLVDAEKRPLFALFIGTALSISALPVIAKTLLDLGLLRTDIGFIVLSAAMVDDVVGWLMFSLLAGPMRGASLGLEAFLIRAIATLVLAVSMLTIGRWLFGRALEAIDRAPSHASGKTLSMVIVAALVGGATSEWIGIHAVFGAFLVGIAVGDSALVRAETRLFVRELVSHVFAPIFFSPSSACASTSSLPSMCHSW